MNIGLGVFCGMEIENQVRCMKKFGVNRTFISSETSDFDNVMTLFKENGIICETLHAPFDGINDMWGEDMEKGEIMLNRFKNSIDKCEKYNIPVTIVHVSSGRPMPDITPIGVERYASLFSYAGEKGVKIALENLRYSENLSYFLDRFSQPGFCWDVGHENCFTDNIKFMELFGNRLCALHIHDNRCIKDRDDHLIPFDANIDFDYVAQAIADSGYNGTVMLEIGKSVTVDGKQVYGNLSDEEYIEKAAASAKKLSDMVESIKGERS